MSNPFTEFEIECGPDYNDEAVCHYYTEHKDLPWLAYANCPTNSDGTKNYLCADAIFYVITSKQALSYTKARICLSACTNATSFQLRQGQQRVFLHGRDVLYWVRILVEIANQPKFKQRLMTLQTRFADENISSLDVDAAFKLAEDCFDVIWM